MATIEEDYVSFDTAKLLKEKGFLKSVDLRMLQNVSFYDNIGLSHNLNKYYDRLIQDKIDFVVAPTLQMAMKWLREVHKIHIIAEPCLGEGFDNNLYFNRWFWTILKEEGEYKPIRRIDEFTTYEQAVEAAIKYCLENLI